MRKQAKIAAVVSTAALLALGASMTSMAAEKGTWKMDDNDWMCYDKNGDAYESTFCMSNGKEYYVGDDGYLVRSAWVDYDGDMYYVNSAGTKTISDWRLLAPYDDEDAEEEWYYFGSKGKRAESDKVVVKDHTYYFDAEGKLLTGWVDGANYDEASALTGDVVFCDETGARASKEWVKTTEIGADEDDEDEFWYYIKSKGTVATGKQGNIKGQTYFFDEEGKMLSGWVMYDATKDIYLSVQGDDYSDSATKSLSELYKTGTGNKFYYCGAEDDGHMKKDKWVKLWNNNVAEDEDYDNSKKWFYLNSDGSVLLPADEDTQIDVERYELVEGEFSDKKDPAADAAAVKIDSKTYYFDANGQMISGLIFENGQMVYLGDDGAMKTGSQTIKDDNDDSFKFYFASKDELGVEKGQGITGAKNGKLYYYGKLVTAEDYKYELVEVAGKYYIVNASGTIQTSDRMYTEDGDDLIDAELLTFDDGKTPSKPQFKGSIATIDHDDNDKTPAEDFDLSNDDHKNAVIKNTNAQIKLEEVVTP